MSLILRPDKGLPPPPPDDKQWHNKFFVRSENSDNLYVVSQHRNGGYWGCSCAGWRIHKKCKHILAMGLPPYMKPFDAKLAK